MPASRNQQATWLATLAASVDHVQLLNGSGTPLGSPVSSSWEVRGLVLSNAAPIALTAATAASLGLYAGTTLLTSIPWVGGTVNRGQLVLSLAGT